MKRSVVIAAFALGAVLGATAPARSAPPQLFAVKFVTPTSGWVAGDAIYATSDGGRTWRRQFQSRHFRAFALEFNGARKGWAAGMDPVWGTGALMGTTDGGAHWTKLGEPAHPLRALSFSTPTDGIAPSGGSLVRLTQAEWGTPPFIGGRIAMTSDGGNTWRVLDEPQSADSACSVSATRALVAYQGSVQLTDDGGQGWYRALSAGVDRHRNWSARIECNGSNAWVLFESYDPISGDQGRPYILYRTTDSATSWHSVLENQNAGEAYPLEHARAWVALDAGPFVTSGADFALLLGFSAPGIVGAAGLVALATEDGGTTWQSRGVIPGVAPTDPVGVSAVDTRHMWVVTSSGGHGRLYASSDGGRTWLDETAGMH